MGTNYYYVEDKHDACPTCGHVKETHSRHIGKSSGGWCFALHVYPDESINNLNDWFGIFRSNKGLVIDENDQPVSLDDMIKIISNRGRETKPDFSASSLYKNEQEFLFFNQAEWGPNNLLRARIGAGHCIGHGEGTYDYIEGDFS